MPLSCLHLCTGLFLIKQYMEYCDLLTNETTHNLCLFNNLNRLYDYNCLDSSTDLFNGPYITSYLQILAKLFTDGLADDGIINFFNVHPYLY